MKRIDASTVAGTRGSDYPHPFDQPCQARERYPLSDCAGLTQFGVNLLRVPPGAWSSQRHWHEREDEFVYILEGEVILVTDAGEERLATGDSAGFKAGVVDGHHLQNRAGLPALVLEVGSRAPLDAVDYPDIDLRWTSADGEIHKDGTPY